MTSWMKCFIDRLYPYFDFTDQRLGSYTSRLSPLGKKALIIGVCEQVEEKEMQYNIPLMADANRVVRYEIADTLYFKGHFKATSVSRIVEDIKRAYEGRRLLVTCIKST